MTAKLVLSLLSVSLAVLVAEKPQQIHLSFGADGSQMVVTWVTMHTSVHPIVEFGINSFSSRASANTTRFVDGGAEKRHFYVHRALLTALKPSQKYQYRCGDENDKSIVYSFVAKTEGSDWSPRLAIYGDLGYDNAQSVPRLRADIDKGMYDAILHVGDFAYDMHDDNARVGDEFMRIIEPLAARVAYQVTPGNHEMKYNFSNYDNRFSMIDRSGRMNNHFFSFDIGSARVISFSTEFYYYTEFGWDQIRTQYEWLERQLKEANRPENRAVRPWIIIMAHKPLYCMSEDSLCSSIDGTAYQRHRLRKGIKMHGKGDLVFGLEDLFQEYGVDIELYGHEHNYQRLFPVYDNRVFNGTKSNPYHNPKAPVVIVTGSAGCREDIAPFRKNIPKWSAFRIADYGYTRMTIHNKTHISVEQVSDDQAGRIVDQFVIIKDQRKDVRQWSDRSESLSLDDKDFYQLIDN